MSIEIITLSTMIEINSINIMGTYMSKTFWQAFDHKDFKQALVEFECLDPIEKQDIFSELFQKSQYAGIPGSVSVLFRRVKAQNTFDDFYKAWQPPRDSCAPLIEHGMLYQQFFKGPVRVINAVSFDDPKEVVSIGLHWITDYELTQYLSDPDVKMNGDKRGAQIATVADKTHSDIYKVLKDDNLGTPF